VVQVRQNYPQFQQVQPIRDLQNEYQRMTTSQLMAGAQQHLAHSQLKPTVSQGPLTVEIVQPQHSSSTTRWMSPTPRSQLVNRLDSINANYQASSWSACPSGDQSDYMVLDLSQPSSQNIDLCHTVDQHPDVSPPVTVSEKRLSPAEVARSSSGNSCTVTTSAKRVSVLINPRDDYGDDLVQIVSPVSVNIDKSASLDRSEYCVPNNNGIITVAVNPKATIDEANAGIDADSRSLSPLRSTDVNCSQSQPSVNCDIQPICTSSIQEPMCSVSQIEPDSVSLEKLSDKLDLLNAIGLSLASPEKKNLHSSHPILLPGMETVEVASTRDLCSRQSLKQPEILYNPLVELSYTSQTSGTCQALSICTEGANTSLKQMIASGLCLFIPMDYFLMIKLMN